MKYYTCYNIIIVVITIIIIIIVIIIIVIVIILNFIIYNLATPKNIFPHFLAVLNHVVKHAFPEVCTGTFFLTQYGGKYPKMVIFTF